MNIGMLWFDNDSKADLGVKIERAAHYYRSKYGKTPTLCFVHPTMLPVAPAKDGENIAEKDTEKSGVRKPGLTRAGIEVRPNRAVLPNHFWIGVNGNGEVSPVMP
jgi:hypothetical protein